jgi:hypothetical protein
MAEFVFRAIGAALEALLDALIAHTGKRVLSFWRLKSNLFVEVLIGLVILAIIGIMLTMFITAVFAKP